MRRKQHPARGVLALLVLAAAAVSPGCAWVYGLAGFGTTIDTTEYWAAVDQKTHDVNFYRTDIHFFATDGQTKLATGWYDRAAFDALGTTLSYDTRGEDPCATGDCDTSSTVYRLGSKAFGDALEIIYTQALERFRNGREEEAEVVLKALRSCFDSGGFRMPGDTDRDLVEHADKRYVYIFSTNPGEIERRIKMATSSENVADSFNMVVAAGVLTKAREEKTNYEREAYKTRAMARGVLTLSNDPGVAQIDAILALYGE